MDLLIDWGNTQLKFVLVDSWCNSEITTEELHACDGDSSLLEFLSSNNIEILDNILISSVKAEPENQELVSKLSAKTNNLYFAKTASQSCGVTCAYQEPEFLGVDRWLAVVAAHHLLLKDDESAKLQNAVVGVISIGTAITLDMVSQGQHLGGHILPGQRLMFESLKQTGRVRPDALKTDCATIALGRSTTECVEKGIRSLIEGYLKLAMEEFEGQHPISHWLIHGGGGKDWFKLLKSSFPKLEHKPSLIFDGLILMYREQSK